MVPWSVTQHDDALELVLNYLSLMREAANAYATELIWAFLMTLGALSLWIWRLLGLQEAERHHDYMVTSRPVFPRSLSPTSLQPSYFSSIYKNRMAAKDRNMTDRRENTSPYEAKTCNQDEMSYKYRSVPRAIWRFPDAKPEDERLGQGERPLEQCDTKDSYWNPLAVTLPVPPVARDLSSSHVPPPTPRPRSRSPLKGPTQLRHIMSDYQRSLHSSRQSSRLSSVDNSRPVDALETVEPRPSRNNPGSDRQDQPPHGVDLTAVDSSKVQDASDVQTGRTSPARRAIAGRQEASWDKHTKTHQYWREADKASDKGHCTDKSFEQEADKKQSCEKNKTSPRRRGKVLTQSAAHTTSFTSKTSVPTARSSMDAESKRPHVEGAVNKDRSKYQKYQVTDSGEQELVERLKRKFFTPMPDRQYSMKSFTSGSNISSLHTQSLRAEQHNKYQQEPNLSEPQSLDVKLVPADARGAAPDVGTEVGTKARAEREPRSHAERSPCLQANPNPSPETKDRSSTLPVVKKTMQDISIEKSTELPKARPKSPVPINPAYGGFPSRVAADSESSKNKKKKGEASELGSDSGHEAGKRLARLKQRLENSLEYLKQQTLDVDMPKAPPSGVLETKTVIEPLPLTPVLHRDPAPPQENQPKLDDLGVAKTSQSKDKHIDLSTPPVKDEHESTSKTICTDKKLSAPETDAQVQVKTEDATKLETKAFRTVSSRLSLHNAKTILQSTDSDVATLAQKETSQALFAYKQRETRPFYSRYRWAENKSQLLEVCNNQKQGSNVVPAEDKGQNQTVKSELHSADNQTPSLETLFSISSRFSVSELSKDHKKWNASIDGHTERDTENQHLLSYTSRTSAESLETVKTASSSIEKILSINEKYEALMDRRYERMKRRKEVEDSVTTISTKSDLEVDHRVRGQLSKDSDVDHSHKSSQEDGKVSAELCVVPVRENLLKNDNLKSSGSLSLSKTGEHISASRKEVSKLQFMSEFPHNKGSHFQANDIQTSSELSTNSLFISRRNRCLQKQKELEDNKKNSNPTSCSESEEKNISDEADGTTSPPNASRSIGEGEMVVRRRVRWRRLAEKKHMEGLSLKIPPPVPPKTYHLVDSPNKPATPLPASPLPVSNEPVQPVDNALAIKQTATEGTEDKGNEKSENEKCITGQEQPSPEAKKAKPPKPPKPQVYLRPDKGGYIYQLKDQNSAGETSEVQETIERSQVCEEKSLSPKEAASIFDPQLKHEAEKDKEADLARKVEWVSDRDGEDGGTITKPNRNRFRETLQKFQRHIEKADNPPSP